MKKWETATMEEIKISETAYGPYHPEIPDSELTADKDEDGNIIGWNQKFGNQNGSI